MSVTILRKVSVTGGTVLRAANNLGDVGSAATSFTNIKQPATTSATGVVELATGAEAATGTDTSRAITPAAMKAGMASELNSRAIAPGMVFSGGSGTISGVPALGTQWTAVINSRADSLATTMATFGGIGGAIVYCFATSGDLKLYKQGVGSLGTVGGVFTAGVDQQIVVTYDGTDVVVYRDGVQVGTFAPAATSFGAPTSIGTSDGSSEPWAGKLRVDLLNYAKTAAEVKPLFEGGVSGADYNSATNTSIVTAFANGGGGFNYDTFSGASATGFTAVKTTLGQFGFANATTVPAVVVGKRYRVSFTLTLNSGVAPFVNVGGGTPVLSTNGANTIEFSAVVNTNTLQFYNAEADASNYSVADVVFVPLGLLLDNDYSGVGPQARPRPGTSGVIDLPGDGATGGVSWSCPGGASGDFGETKTASGYSLGRDAVVIPEGYRIARIWVSGNGTFSIGNAASGTEVVNAFTATSTTQPATLAAYTTTSRKLYITLGTATSLTYAVHLERI